MEILFSFFWAGYLLVIVACWYTWKKLDLKEASPEEISLPQVTVVVAMRNEEANLPALVAALSSQDYPKEKFQVIIVDDASEDESVPLLLNLKQSAGLDLKLISLEEEAGFIGSYKKRALSAGIYEAQGEFIVTTDADCTFGPQWLRHLMMHMCQKNACFISGPLVLQPTKLTGQALVDQEFAALTGIGASFLHWGYPNMCNGANLAFSKEAFEQVGGYSGYEQVVSGDDEFLLYKISQRYPHGVEFLKQPQALVYTKAPASWGGFLEQRRRWSGKWKHHRSWTTKGLAIFIFVFHVMWLASFLLTLRGIYSEAVFLVQLVGKLVAEGLLLHAVLKFQSKRFNLGWFFAGQLLYSCYTVFVGIFANFGTYSWKNRTFK